MRNFNDLFSHALSRLDEITKQIGFSVLSLSNAAEVSRKVSVMAI